MPRFDPQAPPPAVLLGWLVLKNVVPEMVTALPTDFSPGARSIFQPNSLTPETLVASNTSVEVMGRLVAELAPASESVVEFSMPSNDSEFASRSLIMKKVFCTFVSNGCSRSPAPSSTEKYTGDGGEVWLSFDSTRSGGNRNL